MNARTKQFVATVLLICHWGAISHSQAPEWWVSRQARTLNASPDDYALINQGQLKQLAYAAYQEMEEKLVGGAGPQISALVQSWLAPGGAGRDDYAVANIGQLKALASVFHARLQEVGLGVPYTWTADTSDDADFAPANIGQAKAMFAFQLSAGTAIWSGEFQTYKEAYGGLFDEESPFVLHYLDWRCNQVQTHIGETRTLGWTETWQWQLLNGPLNWPEWVKASTHYEALPDGMAPQQWATRYYDPTPYFIKRSVLLEQHHDFVAAPSLLTSIDEYEVQEVFWWPGVRLDLNLDLKQTWLVHDAETGAPVWDSLYPNVSLNDKLASQHGYQYEVTTQTYRESYSDEVTALLPGAPLGQVPPHGLTQSASGPLTNPANGWSPAALTPVDAPLQALASGGETIPFEPMRLPSTGGVMATAKTELEKRPMHHLPEGGQPQLLDRWQGIHCQGKVALAWRTDISDALTPAVMQNWIDRFQVLIEETVSPADGSPPVTTSTSRPLADFLQASDAGPQVIGELNAGSLSGMVDDLNREVRLSLVCSVPALASPFASTGGGTAGGTSGGAGQNGSSDPNPSFVLHMEMPTLEAYVGGREYTLDPPLQSATYSHSAVKRSSKDPQFDYASNLPARLRLSEFPAEIEHLPPLQVDAIGDQIGYLWPFKPDVDDPLMLIGERSFPAFDTCSIPFDNFILVALSSKNTFQDIAYDAGAEDLEIGTFEDTTRYEARTRFRLRAKAPLMLGGQPVNLPQGYRATFLPVVEVRNLLAWGGESDPVETHVLPTLEMEIPPGDSASAIRNVDTLPQLSQHLPAQPNTVVRLRLLPFDIEGYKRGTINTPGAKVPKGSGEYGQETVMMENADSEDNATQPDYATTAVDAANDDDLVKVVLHWPKDMKISGVKLELKHTGMEVDPTKTSDADKYKETGPSCLNFYKPDGTKLTDADLKIDDLGNPGTGYLAEILNTGELTLFIEGAENFGNLGLTASKMKLLGGAMLNFEVTHNGTTSRARLLVYRGGFLVFRQPNGQPGHAGTFEFWDGKGRVKNKSGGYQQEFQEDITDWGTMLESWTAKSGKPSGSADYRTSGEKGYTPPGWWWTVENPLAVTEQQLHKAAGYIQNRGQANEKWNQAAFTRWQQDDAPAGQRYTADYVYDKSIAHDAQIGQPTFVEYKFRLFAIPPSTPYKRTGLLIHPDGKKDGTLGCIGLQTWEGANGAADVLRRYHGLKLKVQDN